MTLGPTGAAAPRPTAADLAHCRALLAEGSRSFAAASRLLPRRVRTPATVLYAFLRVADDLVDEGSGPDDPLAVLAARLDRVWAGRPEDDPVDRALAAVVAAHALPRGPFDALLEGFAWDRDGRSYHTLGDTLDYGVRVAGTVGVLMAWLMGVRRPEVLARACDLGVAMQLTNIARDVVEDAGRGRVYLPRTWLGLAPGQAEVVPAAVRRLLAVAAAYYRQGDAGVSHLPRRARPAIRAARLIYADIGRVIAGRGFDPTRRAVTGRGRKLWLLVRALPSFFWRRRPVDAPWIPGAAARMGLPGGAE